MQLSKIITSLCLLIFLICNLSGQGENLQVEGAIQMSNSNSQSPQPGTIQWNGSDFEGRNNSSWVSLTSGGMGPNNESMYNSEFVNMLFHNDLSLVTVYNDRLSLWSTNTLAYDLVSTEYQIKDSGGNFLIYNKNSPTVYIYNAGLNVWNEKTFGANVNLLDFYDSFSGNFMFNINDDYHMYNADIDTWLPPQYIPPRQTASAARFLSTSDEWK